MAARAETAGGQRRLVRLVNTALAGYVLFHFFTGSGAGDGDGGPALGRPAPDFALKTPDGDEIRLSGLRGKAVVLNLWATWCGPCRAEMPDLDRVYHEHRDRGLMVLGVDVQEPAPTVKKFLTELGASYPVVLDSQGAVTAAYAVSGLPSTFFIGREGTLRDLVLGAMTRDQLAGKVAKLLQ